MATKQPLSRWREPQVLGDLLFDVLTHSLVCALTAALSWAIYTHPHPPVDTTLTFQTLPLVLISSVTIAQAPILLVLNLLVGIQLGLYCFLRTMECCSRDTQQSAAPAIKLACSARSLLRAPRFYHGPLTAQLGMLHIVSLFISVLLWTAHLRATLEPV